MVNSKGRRRGISLLEVLISIFVLAVGLLGVAALIPAGRHEIAQGSRLEYASMIGRAAFRDLKVRGMLNPTTWRDANNLTLWQPMVGKPPFTYNGTSRSPHVAVALDPLGVDAGYTNSFPYPTSAGPPRLRRITTTALTSAQVVDSVFRSRVDLITEENSNSNLPPTQVWFGSNLRRASNGNYSWLATIVSDYSTEALATKLTVSVAVFYKRNLSAPGAGEYALGIQPAGTGTGVGLGGGEVQINGLPADRVIRPGEWMMLTARRTVSPPPRTLDYFRWYRVVSAANKDNSTGTQKVTLSGTDWDPLLLKTETAAFVFDGVVAVYEKNMTLDVQ